MLNIEKILIIEKAFLAKRNLVSVSLVEAFPGFQAYNYTDGKK